MPETISDVGEHPMIQRLTAGLAAHPQVLLGPGDDAAVLRIAGDVVVSTDTMVENVHFKRAWSAAEDVGRKAVASAVADLEAMGAHPVGIVIALSVPASETTGWIDGFRQGVASECERAGCALVGGDLARSSEVVITCTVLGELEGRAPVGRAGALPGQVIACCGNLGMAEAGLAVLRRGFSSPAAVVRAHRFPDPPYRQGAVAAAAGATAMIDISDGLVADLGHIAQASAVQLELDSARLRANADQQRVAAALGGIDPAQFILAGGDDHALVATIAADRVPQGWFAIGKVSEGEPRVLVDGREPTPLGGWDHFK
ncbi:MAG: thiamine-phosphate kinase [Propionibacteriaceae bacterium]|jgi:thiamine-monophosphate kinase|nr:thiamine-phosphate kinase [Propionibacteriaceae bacterium]